MGRWDGASGASLAQHEVPLCLGNRTRSCSLDTGGWEGGARRSLGLFSSCAVKYHQELPPTSVTQRGWPRSWCLTCIDPFENLLDAMDHAYKSLPTILGMWLNSRGPMDLDLPGWPPLFPLALSLYSLAAHCGHTVTPGWAGVTSLLLPQLPGTRLSKDPGLSQTRGSFLQSLTLATKG